MTDGPVFESAALAKALVIEKDLKEWAIKALLKAEVALRGAGASEAANEVHHAIHAARGEDCHGLPLTIDELYAVAAGESACRQPAPRTLGAAYGGHS